MSTDSPSSVESNVQLVAGAILPWKYASEGRCLTCSPIREKVIICMDLCCDRHDRNGKGIGDHDNAMIANDLEWAVVNSFTLVEPSFSVHAPEFAAWSTFELYSACHETDCEEATWRIFFRNEDTKRKLHRYVSTYEVNSLIDKSSERIIKTKRDEIRVRPRNVEEIVREWCGAEDPTQYILLMKRRLELLSGKVNKLQNTVDIWKNETKEKEKLLNDLKWKFRYLKKKIEH
jgi:hypothetical protein